MKPKVMIITMGLSRIVRSIVNNYDVVGVIECARRKKEIDNNAIYKMAKLLYSIARPKLQTLEGYLKDQNIPYYYMDNGSDEKLACWVKEKNPDVIIVYSMSQLLKKNIYEIPRYKTINLHSTFLPRYRGPNPDFWQYYNVEKKGAATVHYIDKGEDTGDIIYQEEFDFPLGMKSPDMLDLAINNVGINLIFKALENIENLPRTKQPKDSPTSRARNIKENEHKDLIDWNNWKIERIWHLLRGTELWLNALEQPHGIFKGQRWSVDDYEKSETINYKIGKIYKKNNKYFVACRDGKIYLSLHFNFNLRKVVSHLIRMKNDQ